MTASVPVLLPDEYNAAELPLTHVFAGGADSKAAFYPPSEEVINLAPYPDSFSQEVNVGSMIENDPELIGSMYEIWTKSAPQRLLAQGVIDSFGMSARVFTKKMEELEIIIGENEWEKFAHTESNNNENYNDQ